VKFTPMVSQMASCKGFLSASAVAYGCSHRGEEFLGEKQNKGKEEFSE